MKNMIIWGILMSFAWGVLSAYPEFMEGISSPIVIGGLVGALAGLVFRLSCRQPENTFDSRRDT